MTRTEQEASYYAKHMAPLVGGVITEVVVDLCEDDEWMDGPIMGLRIRTPQDGEKDVFFMRDPEGDGPGHPEIQDAE